jgi:hypothetical protein
MERIKNTHDIGPTPDNAIELALCCLGFGHPGAEYLSITVLDDIGRFYGPAGVNR